MNCEQLLEQAAACMSNPRLALGITQEVLTGISACSNAPEKAKAHELSGLCYKNLSRYEAAEREFRLAGERYKLLNMEDAYWSCILHSAEIAVKCGRLNEALRAYEQVLEFAGALHSGEHRASAFHGIALVYMMRGEFAIAQSYFLEAARECEGSNERELQAQICQNLGTCYLKQSLLPKALDSFQNGLRLSGSKQKLRAVLFMGLAEVYHKCGEYALALLYYNKAYDLFIEYNDTYHQTIVLAKVAETCECLNNSGKAMEYYRESLRYARLIGVGGQEAFALERIGRMQAHNGQWEPARKAFADAEKIYAHIGDRLGQCQIHFARGETWLSLEQTEKARKEFCLALALAEMLYNNEITAQASLALGKIALSAGRCREAERFCLRAIELAQVSGLWPLQRDCHMQLAQMYEQCGNLLDGKRSLCHYKAYMILHTRIVNEENQKAIVDVQSQAELKALARINERLNVRLQKLEKDLNASQRVLAANHTTLHKVRQEIEKLQSDDWRVARQIEGLLEKLQSQSEQEEQKKELCNKTNRRHEDFLQLLLSECSELTRTELTVCALMRERMPTKKIAELLYVSSRTVEKHRGNIRRKLKLPKRMSFSAYFAGIVAE